MDSCAACTVSMVLTILITVVGASVLLHFRLKSASVAAASSSSSAAAAPSGVTRAAPPVAKAAKAASGGEDAILSHPVYGETVRKILAAARSHPGNRAAKHFSLDYFKSLSEEERVGFAKVVNSGAQNADSSMGCYAMQPSDYDRFKPFFRLVIADYHSVAVGTQHVSSWELPASAGDLDLRDLGLSDLSMRVRVGRNLAAFPLPGAMTAFDRLRMEVLMCRAFDKLAHTFGGRYYSLTPGHPSWIDEDKYNELVAAHIMFKDMGRDSYLQTAGIAADWPVGRGCYVSEDRKLIIWVGEEDHLRIISMAVGSVLTTVFNNLKDALAVIESLEGVEFARSVDYGYVTSCPTNLGTGMRASVHIKVPALTAGGSDARAKAICKPLGLSVRGTGGEHTPVGADGTIDLSPSARFAISEGEIVMALYKGVSQLKAKEDEIAAGGEESKSDS